MTSDRARILFARVSAKTRFLVLLSSPSVDRPTPQIAPRADVRSSFWPLLPILSGTAISTLLLGMALDPELWAACSRWFPFALRPVFHDLWITLQHLHEADLGLDPLSDPTSEFAYPRAVLLLRHVGVHHVPSEWLGFLQGIALTLGVVFVLRPRTPRRAVATSFLFLTPPFLLGFERANLDFALFLLCAAVAWHWARAGRPRRILWPITAAVVGATLKLYPFFALAGGALAEPGRRRLAWLAGIAVVAGYWCLNSAELILIMGKLPVSTGAAWGCLVIFARVDRFVHAHADMLPWLEFINWSLVGLSLYIIAAAGAALLGFRLAPHFKSTRLPRLEWANYWVGALICCGSFLGANLAYRWVFALLTLPLLLRCARSVEPIVAVWSRIVVATLIVSLAAPLDAEGPMLGLIHIANWLCILLLIVGCTAFRATAKSPVFAFFLRLCRPRPSLALISPDVEGARYPTR